MFKAFVGLILFDLVLRRRKLAGLYTKVQAWPIRRTLNNREGTVDSIVDKVNRACTLYPKKALCLQRSAVITCLLRSSGVFAHMVIGAQNMPFRAHAWVDVEGHVLGEPRVINQRYMELARY